MDIYLIRHTQTAAKSGLCYGQSDLALADSFTDERQLLQQKLPDLAPGRLVFSSPLTRCLRLSETLSDSVTTDERLLELNFGDWENQCFDEIESEALRHWTDNFVDTAPPNGESFNALYRRTGCFWQDLVRQQAEQVLVVTHAGVIRALLARVLALSPANAFQFRIDTGSVHKLRYTADYTYIEYLNK